MQETVLASAERKGGSPETVPGDAERRQFLMALNAGPGIVGPGSAGPAGESTGQFGAIKNR